MGDEVLMGIEELALIHRLNQVAVGVVLLLPQVGEHPAGDVGPS